MSCNVAWLAKHSHRQHMWRGEISLGDVILIVVTLSQCQAVAVRVHVCLTVSCQCRNCVEANCYTDLSYFTFAIHLLKT